MPRPSSFRAALAGLLTLGFACGPALAPATAAPAEDPDPLVVHLDSISPVLPRNGDVEISGTVTNVGDETFTRVNLHAFSSQSPILDAGNLARSAAVATGEFVGPRVTVPGTFATIDELAAGESAYFSDTVPVELLGTSGEQGVYWIGIHALGDTDTVPRDDIADGRARTFIPQEPRGNRSQEASVILSIRGRVWYDKDGRIGGLERWARRLEEGGSLDGVLDMADSAGSAPYSIAGRSCRPVRAEPARAGQPCAQPGARPERARARSPSPSRRLPRRTARPAPRSRRARWTHRRPSPARRPPRTTRSWPSRRVQWLQRFR